jgi:LysM repeat protein
MSEQIAIYVVKEGDTLTSIATEKTGYPEYWEAISRYNNLTQNIVAGQILKIPATWIKASVPWWMVAAILAAMVFGSKSLRV